MTWRGQRDAGGLLERAQQEVDQVVRRALLEQALRGQAARRERRAAHQHQARAGALRRLVLADALRPSREEDGVMCRGYQGVGSGVH